MSDHRDSLVVINGQTKQSSKVKILPSTKHFNLENWKDGSMHTAVEVAMS